MQDRKAIFREVAIPGMRLGRHVEHDSKSAEYSIPVDLSKPLKSVLHERKIPILDQDVPKPLGSCTGNAGTGLLGTEPFFSSLPTNIARSLNEDFAVKLYEDATVVDGFPGTYPPDDTGSSGLAVGKVLKKRGEIKAYRHAFGLLHALQALQKVPVIIGIPWFASFDEPGQNGLLKFDPMSPIRGGHELEVCAVDITDGDPNNPQGRIVIPQSWGTSYGASGWCEMEIVDFGELLKRQGDVMTFEVN